MHKIDIHNYEAYLLDFSEGNLSDEGQMELELFLIQHPELQIDLNELPSVLLDEETITFSNKAHLKRDESHLISTDQFVGYVENQLTPTERLEVEKSCASNPSLLKELALYNNTIARVDETIVFENKESLKRKPKVIWFNFSAAQYAAAACVVFLIGLFIFWPGNRENTTSTLANNNTTINTPVQPSLNKADVNPQKTDNLQGSTESNKTLVQQNTLNTNQSSTLASNGIVQSNPNKEVLNNDSLTYKLNNDPPIANKPTPDVLVAQNTAPVVKQQTVVQVISEDEDELLATNQPEKKKGIWAAASRALKNLNSVGVKGVDGDEESNKNNTAYALTLGGVSITHKAGKL